MSEESTAPEKLTALVSEVQRFCLHDGPGVRTTVFYKGCPLRCPWCSNPETIDAAPELQYSRARCVKCGECVRVCPVECIRMTGNGIVIARSRCIRCFTCAEVCPTRALAKKGEEMTPGALLEKVLADKDFYDDSGGGVTASGGEPLRQSDAVAAFLRLVRAEGVHTALETSGYASRDALDRVLPHCDLVYIDIKHADPETHRRLVGVDNRPILDNLAYLAKVKKDFIVRTPLIPGLNMADADLHKLVALLAPLGVRVEPLLFHQLGKSKYPAFGKDYRLREAESPHENMLDAVRERFSSSGINVV